MREVTRSYGSHLAKKQVYRRQRCEKMMFEALVSKSKMFIVTETKVADRDNQIIGVNPRDRMKNC